MSTSEFDKYNQIVLDLFNAEKFDELARLYLEWGKKLLGRELVDEGCFFLTQGYVLALEEGMSEAEEILGILKSHKREI